jgi:hypothetical protein
LLIAGDRRKTMYGGEHETTNNRMELRSAECTQRLAQGASAHGFEIRQGRHHILAEELEATRLEDRRQETGQEPGHRGIDELR